MKLQIRIAVVVGMDGQYSACADGEHGCDYQDAMEAATVWMLERGGAVVVDRFWLMTERNVPDEPPEIEGMQE